MFDVYLKNYLEKGTLAIIQKAYTNNEMISKMPPTSQQAFYFSSEGTFMLSFSSS